MKIRFLRKIAALRHVYYVGGCKSAGTIVQANTTSPTGTTTSTTPQPGSTVGSPFIPWRDHGNIAGLSRLDAYH